jgi:hypothetical protein
MNRESNATSAPASGVTDPRSRPLVALLRALTVLPALITPALSCPEPCGFGQYRSAATAHSCVHPGKRGRRAVIQHAIAVRCAIQSRRPIAGFRAEWALSLARLPSASSGRGSPTVQRPLRTARFKSPVPAVPDRFSESCPSSLFRLRSHQIVLYLTVP